MTLREQLPEHARKVFLNTDHFAETCVYTVEGEVPVTIPALVTRARSNPRPSGERPTVGVWRAVVSIANHATDGITSRPKRGDSFACKKYLGDAADTVFPVGALQSSDPGMWRFEIQA